MHIAQEKAIIHRLVEADTTTVDAYTPFPKPYCDNPAYVKAIYLGCDPSNKWKKRFHYVFALPHGEEYGFGSFVEGHRKNLCAVGLGWESVYVQNLCQNCFTKETSDNAADWKRAAEIWIDQLRAELEVFSETVPVLMTAEVLYKVLLNEDISPRKASRYYNGPQLIPIPSDQNRLRRALIPLYRHFAYDLTKWPAYAAKVRAILGN